MTEASSVRLKNDPIPAVIARICRSKSTFRHRVVNKITITA